MNTVQSIGVLTAAIGLLLAANVQADVTLPTQALPLGERDSTSYYYNEGYFTDITLHSMHGTQWNRLFVDGHVSKGFLRSDLAVNYWARWSWYGGQ